MNLKWHYKVLGKFREKHLKDVIPYSALKEPIVIKDKPYWLFERNKETYVIEYKAAAKFPIRIKELDWFPYRAKRMNVVKDYTSLKINPHKFYSFNQIVTDLCSIKHSNPEHQRLFIITALAQYIDRVNCRISSEKGFGKDCIFAILNHIGNDVAVCNPGSTAAVELRLLNRILVLNELSNMKKEDRSFLQELLLMLGDMKETYERSKRGDGTKTFDTYNLGKNQLSMTIMFNNYEYYESVGQQDSFFDNVFQPAVLDRFIPFRFKGTLDMHQFSNDKDFDKIIDENLDNLLEILKTIMWYIIFYRTELHGYDKTNYISRVNGRHIDHLFTILQFVDLDSPTQEIFDRQAEALVQAHLDYNQFNKPRDEQSDDIIVVEENVL